MKNIRILNFLFIIMVLMTGCSNNNTKESAEQYYNEEDYYSVEKYQNLSQVPQ